MASEMIYQTYVMIRTRKGNMLGNQLRLTIVTITMTDPYIKEEDKPPHNNKRR